MGYLKTMGLAVVAALALVAFTGATTASADIYCSTNTNPCTGTSYPAGTVTSASVSGAAVLTTAGGIINPRLSCTRSDVRITQTSSGGPGVVITGNLTALSFSNCTSTSPTGCSTSGTVSGLPTAGSLPAAGGGNGTFTVAAPTVSFTCPLGSGSVTCSFGGSGTVTGPFTGGNPARVVFTNQTIASTGGAACPTSARWTATYNTSGGGYYLIRT